MPCSCDIENRGKADNSADFSLSIFSSLLMSFLSDSNIPNKGDEQNCYSNASTVMHYSKQHICCVNALPEPSNESTLPLNRNKDVKPSVHLASGHSNPGPECSILPSNAPEQSKESTLSSNKNEDIKTSVYLASGHLNLGPECSILPSNAPEQSSVSMFTSKGSEDVNSSIYLTSGSSTPDGILTNSSAECNGNATSSKTMAFPQECHSVVQNTDGITSQPGQSSHIPLDRNGFNKDKQSTVQLAPAIPSSVTTCNNSLLGNKHIKQVHTSGVKPLSTQPIYVFSTNGLSTEAINGKILQPATYYLSPANQPSAVCLVSNAPSSHIRSIVYHKVHPNFKHLVTKVNENRSPTLPPGDISSGHLLSGNWSSAYHKILPNVQYVVTKENTNGLPTNQSSGNLSSGNVSSRNLSSGNLSLGNMSSENLTPFYRKVHPDFKHLMPKINTYSQPEEKPYKCSKCSLRFSSKEDCSRHFPVHHKKCPYCSEVFSSSAPYRELLKHVVLFHKDKDPCSLAHKSTVISALRGSTPGHFRCCHCGGEFDSLRACLEHRVYSHMVKECWICQKTFSTMDNLKNHIKTHTGEKAYPCSHCPKSFTTSSTRASHVRRHTGQVYRCEHCSFMTVDKTNLELHQNKHTGAKPYKCQYCPMAYGQPGRLKIHERSHTGEKPYPCDQCDKAFTDKYSLVRHVRTHTGEKPYKCSYCDKGFAQGGQLQFHERTHTGEKPYECSHCEKRFTRRQELNKHLDTHEKRKQETQSKRKIVEEDSDLEYSADDVDNQDREERLVRLRRAKQSTKKRR